MRRRTVMRIRSGEGWVSRWNKARRKEVECRKKGTRQIGRKRARLISCNRCNKIKSTDYYCNIDRLKDKPPLGWLVVK